MFRQKHIGLKLLIMGWVGVIGVSGCGMGVAIPESSRVTVSTTSPSPRLADADAQKLYTEFLKTNDLVLAEGGVSPERINEFAASDAANDFLSDADDFRTRGWRLTGSTRFDSMVVQDSSARDISFYVCDDVSGTDIFDQSGRSLAEPDRMARSPWSVVASIADEGTLKIVSKKLWTGENFCQ
jgi:hypothetical protein